MPTLNEYFRTEARDFLNTLERSLERTPAPDADELHRAVRGLRGTAQMAREQRVFDVVSALESVTRSMAGGALAWSDNIAARARETIADLRALLDGAEDEERLDERVSDAAGRWREADPDPVPVAEPPVVDPGTSEFREFAAREAAAISDALDHGVTDLQADPMNREPLMTILRRQRALLGSARLEEIPVIADILRAVEDLTRVIVKLDVGVKQEWLDIYRVARDALQTTIAPLLRDELPQSSNSVSRLRHMREELLERYGSAVEQPPPAEDPLARTTPPVTAAPRHETHTAPAHTPPVRPFMGPARSTPPASPSPSPAATASAPPAGTSPPAPASALRAPSTPVSSTPPWLQRPASPPPIAPPEPAESDTAGDDYEPQMLDLSEDAVVDGDTGMLELDEESVVGAEGSAGGDDGVLELDDESVVPEETATSDLAEDSVVSEDTAMFDLDEESVAPDETALLDLGEESVAGDDTALLDLGEESVVEGEAGVLELDEEDVGDESNTAGATGVLQLDEEDVGARSDTDGATVPDRQEALQRALELRDVIAKAAAHDPRAREALTELYDLIRSTLG
ncbi:MAG TPA: hypothetical protein VHG09_08420 [Longimicrobiales bacterium]|nr:hypothetical protein [Longimicrobiales bacterium]